MTDFLAITTLDVAARQNNREHHVLRHFSAHFNKVTVVYRARFGIGSGARALVRESVRSYMRDGIQMVAVDPRLNPGEGAVQKGPVQPSTARNALGMAIDTAGILRDKLTIRALARAAAPYARPDMVCEAFGPWAAAAAGRLAHQGKLGRWVYVDRDYEPGFMRSPARIRWAQRTEADMAARADLTLSIGQRLADRFAHIPSANIALSPTGVDLAQFPAAQVRSPGNTVIFVGEVAPWSGIKEAIGAMARLRTTHPRVQLLVFGPVVPGYQRQLDAEITRLNVADRVTLFGDRPRSHVIDQIAKGSIGLAVFRPHPLRIHAAPLKIWEYMACGLPVLALDRSEAGDIVTRHGTGSTCAAMPDAIARSLAIMLDDPQTFRAMSRAGPKAARAHDWTRVMSAERTLLADLYNLPHLAEAT